MIRKIDAATRKLCEQIGVVLPVEHKTNTDLLVPEEPTPERVTSTAQLQRGDLVEFYMKRKPPRGGTRFGIVLSITHGHGVIVYVISRLNGAPWDAPDGGYDGMYRHKHSLSVRHIRIKTGRKVRPPRPPDDDPPWSDEYK